MCFRLNKYSASAFSVLVLFFLSGCQGRPPEFSLSHTGQTEIQETVVVEIDNCKNPLPAFEIYHSPYRGKAVGAENLIANGGEPFRSITRQIWEMYGTPVEKITLSVPARTHQEFTILITRINYQGIVTGKVVEANKINPDQTVTYFYPFNANIEIASQQDIACSPQ